MSQVRLNLVITRGLKKLGYGRFLTISRYRNRKSLPPAPSASGPLTDDYDWSYPDGTPGYLNCKQSRRYVRDQEFARTVVDFNSRIASIRAAKASDTQAKITDDQASK